DRVAARKEQRRYGRDEIPVDAEIIPFEDVTDDPGGDRLAVPGAGGFDAARGCGHDPASPGIPRQISKDSKECAPLPCSDPACSIKKKALHRAGPVMGKAVVAARVSASACRAASASCCR